MNTIRLLAVQKYNWPLKVKPRDIFLLAGACAFLSLHLIAPALFPQAGKTISYAFLIIAPLLAAAACFAHRSNGSKLNWLAMSLGLALWAAGMAANAYVDLISPDGGQVSGIATLFYILYGVPLIFTIASPKGEIWPARLTDGFLALVLGGLLFACTFSIATVTNTDEAGFSDIRWMFDLQNICIFAFYCIKYVAENDRSDREFYLNATIFAFVYLVAAGFTNHVTMDEEFGGISDALIDLPFLLLFFSLLRQRNASAQAPVRSIPPSVGRLVNASSPLSLPLSLYAVSCFLIFHRPWLAVTGFVVTLSGYSLRNVFILVKAHAEKDRLERLSRVDALTQLANRRTFDEVMAREFARLSRSGRSLSLLMVDIDHFKMLNDAYGHPEGDRYLREIARTIAACASRASDLPARYGGEEFAVILPEMEEVEAALVARRILQAVTGLALPSPAHRGIVTVSIGLANTAKIDANSTDDLLAVADAALYQAKKTGRNCMVVAPPSGNVDAAALSGSVL